MTVSVCVVKSIIKSRILPRLLLCVYEHSEIVTHLRRLVSAVVDIVMAVRQQCNNSTHEHHQNTVQLYQQQLHQQHQHTGDDVMLRTQAHASPVTAAAAGPHTVSYVAHLTGALAGCLVALAILKAHTDKHVIVVLQRVCGAVCATLWMTCLAYLLGVKLSASSELLGQY